MCIANFFKLRFPSSLFCHSASFSYIVNISVPNINVITGNTVT